MIPQISLKLVRFSLFRKLCFFVSLNLHKGFQKVNIPFRQNINSETTSAFETFEVFELTDSLFWTFADY